MRKRSDSFGDNRDRLERMAKVGDAMGWAHASQVLTPIYSVPTIFPQYDEILRVGGHPLERVTLVHGPSNEGKTAFVLGLGKSFLMRDHFFGFVDAERTTPSPWIRTLYRELADHPGFRALVPDSYEDAVAKVRAFGYGIAEARASGQVDPDTTGIVVVDSIRKLMPKNLVDKLLGDPGEVRGRGRTKKAAGIDGYGGRANQYKAALNAQWMDDLCVLINKTKIAVVIISRESEDLDADPFSGDDFKVQGGKSLFYESGVVVRVIGAGPVKLGEKDGYRMIGERHRLVVRKTKIGKKEQRRPEAFFHTSNGVEYAEGFDGARDLIELGLDLEVLKLAGSHVNFGKRRLGQGTVQVCKRLHGEPELFAEVDAAVRAKFRTDETRSAL